VRCTHLWLVCSSVWKHHFFVKKGPRTLARLGAGLALARHVAAGRGLSRQVTVTRYQRLGALAISLSEWEPVYYPNMLKRFSEWFGLKKKLHERQQTPPLVSEREVWWASVGENVGSEINGKSALFSRPVIIYKKLSHGFYFVIPTTTQKKEGSWFVRVRYQRTDMTACLHQARAIDHRRLSSRLGQLDGDDFENVQGGFRKLYK
jgi:mRNA interferase MazF